MLGLSGWELKYSEYQYNYLSNEILLKVQFIEKKIEWTFGNLKKKN